MPVHYFYGWLKGWAGECLKLLKLSYQIGSSGTKVPNEEQTVRRPLQKALEKSHSLRLNRERHGKCAKYRVQTTAYLSCSATPWPRRTACQKPWHFPWKGLQGRLCFSLCLRAPKLARSRAPFMRCQAALGLQIMMLHCRAGPKPLNVHLWGDAQQFAGDWYFV